MTRSGVYVSHAPACEPARCLLPNLKRIVVTCDVRLEEGDIIDSPDFMRYYVCDLDFSGSVEWQSPNGRDTGLEIALSGQLDVEPDKTLARFDNWYVGGQSI